MSLKLGGKSAVSFTHSRLLLWCPTSKIGKLRVSSLLELALLSAMFSVAFISKETMFGTWYVGLPEEKAMRGTHRSSKSPRKSRVPCNRKAF